MNILLTGATGYIGKRLLPKLVEAGHDVVCCVRDVQRFNPPKSLIPHITVIEVDFLDDNSLSVIPKEIDAAYYLMHSMSSSNNYADLEQKSAVNFRNAISETKAQHIIYLSGIVNEESLSKHLSSRKLVEFELSQGSYNFTALRAGIIIGSGSASFEIMRDLVEKLPIMVTPKWLNTRCQPIGVTDVISFLSQSLLNPKTFNKNFDIGGPDIVTYKEMLLGLAKVRGLKRFIYTVPIMTPRLSSYWLYFVTSTSYKLAVALVNSMKIEVVCRNNDLNKLLNIDPIPYVTALQKTLIKVQEDHVVSSWKDSQVSGRLSFNTTDFMEVPVHGCFIDQREMEVEDFEKSINKIWGIGGNTGWYYADWLWKFRGFLDKLVGGVGVRRGRTHESELNTGDSVDFWRVLAADKKESRLLLFAEMKLPGEAWLEFKIENNILTQTATFRPKGLWGRLYWYAVYPFHGVIFNGMLKAISK